MEPRFVSLDDLPASAEVDDGQECFASLMPPAQSRGSVAIDAPPGVLSADERSSSVVKPRIVRPIGYYIVNNGIAAGRSYLLRDGAICQSPSTMPHYWIRALRNGTFNAPAIAHRRIREVADPAVVFVSRDYNSWGHFWLDTAPRLDALWRYRPDLLRTARIVLPADLSRWGRDALTALFALDAGRFEFYDPETEAIRCRTAIVPTMVHSSYAFHPEANAFYDRVVAAYAGRQPAKPRPWYVTRSRYKAKRSGARMMANAAEAEALATSLGFDVLAPEELDWQDQVTTFAAAPVVAGEHGSAMKSLLFAGANTFAVIINDLNQTQRLLAALRGQRCIVLKIAGFRPDDHSAAYSVDIETLRRCLTYALEATGLPGLKTDRSEAHG